ncbi:MAG TPA: hypothetical protein VNS58_11040 [Puia sp.]|nr:hypothetical protein [Puia sp.]
MSSPILYVIAGPNGIGKTTSDFDLVANNIPVINSDEIAAEIKGSGLLQVSTQEYANREALRLMNEHLQKRSSFAIETNLADLDTWKFLLEVQRSGYLLHIIYISTNNLDVLNSRIKERHQLGGHFVRPDIVKERYLAGLNLLNHYLEKPDRLQLFDNSVNMQLVAEINKGQIVHAARQLPTWITQYLVQLFNIDIKLETKARDLNSIEEVRKRYLENKQR